MVADHERSAGHATGAPGGREGERIDHVVDDVTGQGTVEGSQIVQGGVEEGKLMKLGSIAPRLAAHGAPGSIISRDRSTPTTRYPSESRASQTRPGPQPASRIRLPGGNSGEPHQPFECGRIALDRRPLEPRCLHVEGPGERLVVVVAH